MKKKILAGFLIIAFLIFATACTKNENKDFQEKASIAGICLGDRKEKVLEALGKEFKETYHDEAAHFPEAFYAWDFEEGIMVIIGKNSETVLQINASSPNAETNLGIKAGDSAEKVLSLYREKYVEPESIHGGKLLGVFKVECGQALIFDFNTEDGIVNPMEEIKPDEKVERIILTYPTYIDDSF